VQDLIPKRLPSRRLFAGFRNIKLPESRQFSAGSEMKRKLLISVLTSLGIVVGGVAVAYAIGTFKANQQGYRQGGEGQAARITMRVEAGMADPNSELIPDDYYFPQYSPGGALSFSIANTSDLPLQVTKVEAQTIYCGTNPDGTSKFCQAVNSNKNTDGTFTGGGSGSCGQYASFVAPANYNNWPTIAPHATLQVNGTDNNRLGAGTLHLANNTPQGCQGATFIIGLNVTAAEATTSFGFAP
jgi:hypothetical protein